jgi:iron(III) transport system substrate-binding protein
MPAANVAAGPGARRQTHAFSQPGAFMSTPAPAPSAAEDRLVIYSAAEKKYCTGLLEGFNVSHPGIEVEFVFGISTALHERYLAELAADRPAADVLWSSAMDLQMQLVLAGNALPYASAEAAGLPGGAVYRDMAYVTTTEPLVTLVNRMRFDARLPAGSLAEIAAALESDAEGLRGRVAAYDIERNGLGFLALLHESRREARFEAFMRALAACGPEVFGSTPPLVEAVASGRAALAYHVLGSYAARAVRHHSSLAIAASNAPALAVSRVAIISRRAPHPEAARLFLDYLLSRDGQRRLGGAGLYPVRQDTGAGDLPGVHAIAPIRIDGSFEALLDAGNRRALLSRWRAVSGGRNDRTS